MSETEEIAKAVQEVAKTTDTAITAGQMLGAFVSRTIAEPLEETMGILTDRLQFMRFERRVRLVDKANEIIGERQLQGKTRVVPPKIALPIIENASLEEDDFLQDMWVNLLISAMDESKEMPRTAYIDIIKVLTHTDAKLLKHLYDEYIPNRYLVEDPAHFPAVGKIGEPAEPPKMLKGFTSPSMVVVKRENIMAALDYRDVEMFEVSVDNLIRVGCASLFRKAQLYRTHMGSEHDSNYDKVCITSLGVSFVDACMCGAE